MDELVEKELGSLGDAGKKLWESVYDASKKAGDSKEVAARKAWSAVKKGWEKNDKGEWVKKKSEPLSEFSFAITKVSVDKSEGGLMKWRAVASDTSPDLYAEQMSTELFDDFVQRIDSGSKVPSPFDKVLNEDWNGGMPYLSIAHYKSGREGKNVPGMPEKIYRDGNRLKAVGTLADNDLGRAVFKSLCEDLYTERAKEEGKIRISIGFLDLEHKHMGEGANSTDYVFTRSNLTDTCPLCQEGTGNKVYTKGQLVHLALTRVPVNPRTDMEVSKSMIETKKDDAASIVGKELSEALEEKSLVQSDAIVIKSDAETEVEKAKANCETEDSPADESEDKAEMDKKHKEMMAGKSETMVERKKIAADPGSEELTYEEDDEEKREMRRNRPAGERSLLQKSFENIEQKIVELKSQNVPAETALKEIQPLYAALGEQVKKSFESEPAQQQAQSNEIAELANIVKSLAETVSTLQQSMSTEMATLKAQVGTAVAKSTTNGVPTPRSISARDLPPVQPRDPNKPLSILELAQRSTMPR